MGARIYIPTLGRFTQVDPIEGGTENNYVYPTDPVNEFDLTGLCVGRFMSLCARAVPWVDKVTNRGWQGLKSIGRKLSPWNGQEFKIRNNIRFKPLGHWTNKNPYARVPHYHNSKRPGGTGHHRPWQPFKKNSPYKGNWRNRW